MVAIFTGLGAGFERGSAAALGSTGLLGSALIGRAGEGVFLNAATGNLLLNRQDEFLVGRGPDLGIGRTYNSLGALDENGDNWRQSTDRRIIATGTFNVANHTVVRVSGDGSQVTYTYNNWGDGSYYRATDGSGAHDKLVYTPASAGPPALSAYWTWTEGSSQLKETYGLWKDANNVEFGAVVGDTSYIARQYDADLNNVTFQYTSGKLTRIATANDATGAQSAIEYGWTGSAITSVVTKYRDLVNNVDKTLTRTTYTYSSGRLATVTIDETPEDTLDNGIAEKIYTVSYTYDANNRISTISQTDGSSLAITYDGQGRVATLSQVVGNDSGGVSQAPRVTSISYVDEGNGLTRTEVTDPRGQVTKIWSKNTDNATTAHTDERGQLVRVQAPPAYAGATPQEINYTYDAFGNVASVTDAPGSVTSFLYDTAGNTIRITDPNGNKTYRAYDIGADYTAYVNNYPDLLSAYNTYIAGSGRSKADWGEEHWVINGAGEGRTLPLTGVAGTNVLLREVRIGMVEGVATQQVTRFVYDGENHLRYAVSGEGRVTEYRYRGPGEVEFRIEYPQHLYAMGWTLPTETQMNSWRDGLADRSTTKITQFIYDDRGNVIETYANGVATTAGAGAAGDGYSHSILSYDQAGLLRTRRIEGQQTESFFYDGMGRLTASTDLAGGTTTILFADVVDGSGKTYTTVTTGSGQTIVSTHNKAGDLLSTNESGTVPGSGTYLYDKNGRVRRVAMANGAGSAAETNYSYIIYDGAGKKIADIGQNGELTEYRYDLSGRIVATARYNTLLTAPQISSLNDPNSEVTLASIRPVAAAGDIWQWTIYDTGGRVIETILGDGSVTTYAYDASDRLIATTSFANKLDVTGYATTPPNAQVLPTGGISSITRTFYDRDGRVIASLGPEGAMTRFFYDGAGQKVMETSYANLTSEAQRATGTLAQLMGSFAADANKDISTRFIYDGQGFLRFTIDAMSRVTEFVYFDGTAAAASGLVRKTIVYAATIGSLANNLYATVKSAVAGLASSANDRVTYNVYNDRGQLAYAVDATGAVSGFVYDNLGRVTKTTRFAAIFNTTTIGADSAWKTNLDAWALSNGANARITRNWYGARSGDLIYTVDPEGYVTKFDYEAQGRVFTQYRYANKITVGDTTTIANIDAANKGAAATTSYQYDALGRQHDTYDANGTRYFTIYNANGLKAYEVVAFGQGASEDSWTGYDYDLAGRLKTETRAAGTAEASVTQYQYDGLGNLTTITDPRNVVTTLSYDKAGRIITRKDATGTSSERTTTYDYDAFGRSLRTTLDPAGLNIQTYTYFDRLSRITKSVDAESYVTETSYSPFSEVSAVTRRANKATAYSLTAEPTVAANAAFDATTTYEYDKLSRMTKTIDAMGGITQFKLNAFGQTVKVTDALGNASYAYYDLLGRLALAVDVEGYVTKTTYVSTTQTEIKRYISRATGSWSETAPPIEGAGSGPAVATNALDGTTTYVYDGLGRLIDETNALGVVTHYVYDRRGNVTQKVEGYGLGATERRTTTYAYDDLNRVTNIGHDQVAAAQSATGAALSRTESFYYDAASNLVEKRDAAGARTLYWYTALGQLKYQLAASETSGSDQKGTLTRNDYDAAGNVTETRVFGAPVTLPTGLPGSNPSEPGSYRRTLFVYDKLGRLKETNIPDMRTAVYANGTFTVTPESTLATLSTKYEYDALGNTLLVTDANQNKTWSYYDKLGRKIAQIDAGNYRTDFTYNANSNVTSEKRYSIAGTVGGNSAPVTLGVLPTSLPTLDSASDRVTNFTYDKIGRVLTETRTGVLIHNGSGAHTTANAVITYTYNALGAVLSKQEASGDTITYAYDKVGRLLSEERAGFTDFAGTTNVKPRVEYTYNALNDLTQTKAVGNANAAERTTSYVYGAGGLLASKTDAASFTRTFVYDEVGRVKREEYVRVRPDGSSVTEASAYDYDLAGRVTRQGVMVWTGSAWSRSGAGIDTAAMTFNAYGEISERGLAHYDVTTGAETLNLSEKFEYDGAGRISRTNAGDGTWKYFMYDAAGNQTLVIQSVGADLNASATDSLQEVLNLWAGGTGTIATSLATAGVIATITSYDARNNAIEVREPQRQLATAAWSTFVTTRSFNAFGDTAYEINALNARVDYTYNTMGRLIKVESPGVSVTAANGTVTTNVRPTEHRYYDASGRLVAARDANSNLTKYTLLSGTGYNGAEALITETWNADGGVIRTKYDIHGDARRIENPLYHATNAPQHVRTQSFDKMGRLIQVNQEGGLIEYYRYDGLGQRIRRFNSFYNASYNAVTDPTGAAASEAEKTFYDAQGRITQQIAPGGDTTSYAYAWDSALITGGMTTAANPFGGWTQTTTYQNGKTLIEKNDVFGRLVGKTDLGGNVTGFTYDMAGRLTQRTGGITLNQTYFNTGKLSKVSQDGGYVFQRTTPMGGWERETITYREETFGYDALGNVVAQKLRETGLFEWETPGFIDGEGMWEPGQSGSDAIDQVLSDQTAAFDALGRIVQWNELGGVKSPIASHIFQYDANGNVRRSLATFRALDAAGGAATTNTTQDYWYRFDAMNRMTTAKGVLSGGVISRGTTGIDITYRLDGQRAYMLQGTAWREDYTYDNEGRVIQVNGGTSLSAAGIKRAAFTYDALGRQTSQTDYNGTSGYLGAGANLMRTVVFNAKNQIVSEDRYEHRNDDIYRTLSTYSYGTGANYALGAVTEVVAQNWKDGSGWPTTKTTNSYVWRDGAVQSLITYDPDNNPATANNWTTNFTYDIIGGQAQLRLATIADGNPRTIKFTSDMLAQAIRREQEGGTGKTAEVWYRYSGRQMGRTGFSVDSNVNYYQSNGNRVYGANPAANADFDLAYDHITTFEQGSAGGAYTVQSGDTLTSIAANLWGDANLWYKIAEVNGLTAESVLVEGQVLIIPVGVQANANNASTFKPYDPLEVLGNVSPTTAIPKKGKNCGAFGQVLLAIIAVVVTIWTAGALGTTFAGLGTVGSGAATGAVSAAAGSIASQAVGVATGIQERFSWNAVAMAAIGGAVGGGISAEFGQASTPLGAATRAVAGNVITQGIGVATGLQKEFSWAGVAAAGVGAAFGKAVGDAVGATSLYDTPTLANFGANVVKSGAQLVADAATRSLIEGSDFGDNVLAALPNALGSLIGEGLMGGLAGRTPRGPVAAAGSELPSDFPFAVDENGRVDPAAVKAYVRDHQYGVLDMVDTGNGYEITAAGAAFDENGRLYHPEGATETLFEYNMDSKRPLAGIWVALPESQRIVHLITDGNGVYVYGGSGDARIADLGLNIRASSVSEDIVVTASGRGGRFDWRESFAQHRQNSAELISALGWAARETVTGIPQGAVQGTYDLARMGADAAVSLHAPWLRGRVYEALEWDIFGAPTSRWQAAGRVVGQVGLPLPGNAARVLATRALTLTRALTVADAAPSMRMAVAAELDGLRAAGFNPSELSPAISVAVDLETGQRSLVHLNRLGPPETLNPLLAGRLEAANATGYARSAGGAGSHAEIYAVNELVNGGSRLENIAVYTQELRIARYMDQYKPACPHCRVLLHGVTYVE